MLADFVAFVDFKSPSDCWIWTGPTLMDQAKFRGHNAQATSYALFRGPVASGQRTATLCKSALCVNPQHLILMRRPRKERPVFSRCVDDGKFCSHGRRWPKFDTDGSAFCGKCGRKIFGLR